MVYLKESMLSYSLHDVLYVPVEPVEFIQNKLPLVLLAELRKIGFPQRGSHIGWHYDDAKVFF